MRPVRLTRAQQQARTRERLLQAAEVVFARLGYGGASVDLIAAEAGYSKGAVYSNFASKEAIFLELARLHMERDFDELEEILGRPVEQIEDAVAAWLRDMHARADFPALMIELELHARRSPEFAAAFYRLQDQKQEALGRIIAKYFADRGEPAPLEIRDLARIFDALGNGLALQTAPRDPSEPNEAGRIMYRLLRALTDRPASAQARPSSAG